MLALHTELCKQEGDNTGDILKIPGEADGSIELEKSYIQLEKP